MQSYSTEPRSTASKSNLEVTGYNDKEKTFIVKSQNANTLKISDTYAEMFPLMETSPAQSPFFYYFLDN
jgi:hypothetical protein